MARVLVFIRCSALRFMSVAYMVRTKQTISGMCFAAQTIIILIAAEIAISLYEMAHRAMT